MAERNQCFEALLLRSRDSPAGDKIVTLLGSNEGIVDVFVFGGHKSTLRSSATPYVLAKVFIYTDPVKNYRRLSDIVILESFSGLRTTYDKLLSAGVLSEVILKTSACGGEYERVKLMAVETLQLIAERSESLAHPLLYCFLWKILDVMGLRPDTESCIACGKDMSSLTAKLYFSPLQEGFLCGTCGHEEIPLEVEDLVLLRSFSEHSISEVADLAISPDRLKSLRRILFPLIQQACEGTLLTLMME